MREGWKYKKIKDIGSVIGGTTPNTNVTEYWDGTLCWISPAELDGSHYLYDSKKKITETAVKAKNLKLLPEGTVILSSRAPIGKVVINKVPTYCNQGFKCVICGKEIYNEFLYWWLWGKTEYLNSLGTGATFKEISKKVVEEITIPVPPLSEQQSIVDYLDSAFAKIDAMKANAEKSLNEAKALFQASLKEMLEPKEGWEEKRLVNEFSLKSGDNLPAKNQVNGPYPVYGGNGITGFHNEYNLSGNQILIGRVGALCGNIHHTEENIWVTDNAFIVNGISDLWDMSFLTYELEYIDLNQYASQTAQPVISNKSMKDVFIFLPPLSEQQSIVATLDSLKSKVDRLQENFDKIARECDALKQAILRQVFE